MASEIYFFLMGAGVSLALSVKYLLKSRSFQHILLANMFFSLALIQFISASFHNGEITNYYWIIYFIIPAFNSVGIAAYIYFADIIEQPYKVKAIDLLLFSSGIFTAIASVIYLFTLEATFIKTNITNINSIIENNSIFYWLYFASFTNFTLLLTRLFLRYRKYFFKDFFCFSMRYVWIKLILFLVLVTVIFQCLIILTSTPFPKLSSFSLSFLVFILFIRIELQPEIFEYFLENKRESKTTLHLDNEAEVLEKLEAFFNTQKVYLDNELTLNRLAQMLELRRDQLSCLINNHFKVNFSNYVNKFRIEYVINLLVENPDVSIYRASIQAGFNSASSFYSSFKKTKKVSPKEYIKDLRLKTKLAQSQK